MSENKAAAPAAGADKAPKAKKAKAEDYMKPKSTKPEWTAERCAKYAKRFETVDAWKSGSPASYKAADAKGWVAQCSKHMTGSARKQSFKKSA